MASSHRQSTAVPVHDGHVWKDFSTDQFAFPGLAGRDIVSTPSGIGYYDEGYSMHLFLLPDVNEQLDGTTIGPDPTAIHKHALPANSGHAMHNAQGYDQVNLGQHPGTGRLSSEADRHGQLQMEALAYYNTAQEAYIPVLRMTTDVYRFSGQFDYDLESTVSAADIPVLKTILDYMTEQQDLFKPIRGDVQGTGYLTVQSRLNEIRKVAQDAATSVRGNSIARTQQPKCKSIWTENRRIMYRPTDNTLPLGFGKLQFSATTDLSLSEFESMTWTKDSPLILEKISLGHDGKPRALWEEIERSVTQRLESSRGVEGESAGAASERTIKTILDGIASSLNTLAGQGDLGTEISEGSFTVMDDPNPSFGEWALMAYFEQGGSLPDRGVTTSEQNEGQGGAAET